MRRAIGVAAGQHHALAILGVASPPFSRPAPSAVCKAHLDCHQGTVPSLRSLCEAKAQEMVELANLSSCLAFAQVQLYEARANVPGI